MSYVLIYSMTKIRLNIGSFRSTKRVSSIQYGNRNCGTRVPVPSATLAHTNRKNKTSKTIEW